MLAILALSGCSRPSPPVTLGGIAFYSMAWQVKLRELPSGVTATALQAELQTELDAINRALSTYQPDTELMRFNASPVGTPVGVSPILLQALQPALAVSAATDGRYDVTIGPLVNLWGFGAQGRPERVPDAAAIAAARARVGWQHLQLDAATRELTRQRDLFVDLSSVGEGVAVDRLVAVLERRGVQDYLVGVAGTLRTRGLRPDGQSWQLAVEQPDGSGRVARRLNLPEGGAISTSGSYRNYFEQDGVRYSHTIDPRSGRPISHHGVSVTVMLAPGKAVATADAWATALNVLGPQDGLVLANRLNLAALFIAREQGRFTHYVSDAAKPLLTSP